MSEINQRTILQGNTPKILTCIYQESTNMVIWQRTLSPSLTTAVNEFLLSDKSLQIVKGLAPETALFEL